MDEDRIQQNRRDQDEKATQERAAILGISYFDAREVEQTLPLANDVLGYIDYAQEPNCAVGGWWRGRSVAFWRHDTDSAIVYS